MFLIKCVRLPKFLHLLFEPKTDKARFIVEIKEKAEAAKIELSTKEYATIETFGILKDENNQFIDIDVSISRPDFDQLLESMVNRISHITKQILHEIRFEPELIDTVLMVGGSSHIPAIQDELKNIFGPEKVMIHARPMLAVAEGAALMAAKISGQENLDEGRAFSIMHTAAHDYYLQLADGKKHLLVARNSPLPITVEEKLMFSHHEQVLARLRVFNEVEGVLDVVGELWFHKEDAKPYSATEGNPTEIMLQFSVGEDNIITMKAWSIRDEKLSVEAKIARGGLAAKLYNDLERTLSSIVASTDSGRMEEDALRLSRHVVSTILSASDPITGETCVEKKKKAQDQISTLKHCQEEDVYPLGLYEFALDVQRASASILSKDEKSRLDTILEELHQASENLDDIELLKHQENELEKFYDDLPIVLDLARAENVALGIEDDHPGDAKKIRKKAKKIVDYYVRQENDMVEDEQEALNDFIYRRFSRSHDRPSGRFDRDVRL